MAAVPSSVLRSAAALGGRLPRAPGAAAVLSAQQPGGTRRHLRRWDQAPREVRPPHTAPLVTEPGARAQKSLADVVLAQVSVPDVPVGRPPPDVPESLDTRHRRVELAGGDLRTFRSQPEVDASIRNLRTTLLNDGGATHTAAQLELVREEIMDYFHKTMTLTEKQHEIFATASAFFEKHERLRHPPIFYLGHTASFYVNKLHLGKFIERRLDPVLEMQMAVGVDEMSWDDLDSKSYVWPSGAEARADEQRATAFLQKVLDFRRDVRLLVDGLMRRQPMEYPVGKDSFWWVILMGIEHERIHVETSSMIHRQASLDCIQRSGAFPICTLGRFHSDPNSVAAKSMPANRLIPIERGTTRVGRSWEGTKTYGWDNEFGKVSHLDVPAFAASEFLVSNKEFLDFVEAGGYLTERYWTEEGWRWLSDMKPNAPRFWTIRDGGYHLRTLCEEVPMPWDWPVEVCNHEAAAFCRWLSERTGKPIRLPMEDEYLRLRDSVATDLQDSAHGPAWRETPGNINLAYWASPCPVDTFKSPLGVYDVLGNVWQHSATHIDVLDGFATHPLYDDFTAPTIGEEHSRIMGGSWISTGVNGATRDSRFGFRRHFYQHAGFRYVESHREVTNSASPYERDRALCDAFRFHFDEPPAPTQSFHRGLAEACVDALQKLGRRPSEARVMELGCGPGRSVLELAKHGFAAVHGADRSAKGFQCTAQRLLTGSGRLRWVNYLEGEHVVCRELTQEDLRETIGSEVQPVQFFQMPDFAAVDTQKFHDYDLVVCAQPGVLSKSDALGLLAATHKLLKPGGILAVGTQYEWPAAGVADGASSGEEVLAKVLSTWYDPVASPVDLLFERAETARKFERGTQHLTFWQRRAEPREGDARHVNGIARRPTEQGAAVGQAMYDADATVAPYLDFHYGPKSEYPAACAARCVEVARSLGVPLGKALEVGCGPGRAALELSRAFAHVDAGDYSRRFVDLAQELLREGRLQWEMPLDRTSGRTVQRSVRASDLQVGGACGGSSSTRPQFGSVFFDRLDAQNLPQGLRGYDLICGFNLIDRLPRPREFLRDARCRLNPGGLLVLSSPYSWAEEFTPKEQWLGGFKYGDNDGPSSYVGLKELLQAQGFVEAARPEDIWFRLDELDNGRSSQHTRAQMTFWRLPAEAPR